MTLLTIRGMLLVTLPAFLMCSASAPAQTPDVQSAPAATGVTAATGQVVGPGAVPAVGVPVIVQGPAGTTHAFTDAHGKWFVYNLAPGEYQVKPALKATGDTSVNFSVKDRGLFGRLIGSQTGITTSVMTLDRSFQP